MNFDLRFIFIKFSFVFYLTQSPLRETLLRNQTQNKMVFLLLLALFSLMFFYYLLRCTQSPLRETLLGNQIIVY